MRRGYNKLGVGLVAMATFSLTAVVHAQQSGGDPDDPMDLGVAYERMAFDAADTDGDGVVDAAEFTRDAAAAFAGLDRNRDRKLTPDELGPHDPKQFSKVDANGDGALTFSEVMTYKMEAFEAADDSGDGALSYEEMVESVKAE